MPSRKPAGAQRGARGHVNLRLGERALPISADRGYSLLRDPQRLAEFLAEHAQRLPHAQSATHFALPLGPGDAEKLIVTASGRGVTCLSADMATTSPVLPWEQIAQFLDRQHRLFRAQLEVQREPESSSVTPLQRSYLSPWRVTREEFQSLETLAPLCMELAKENVVYATDALALLSKKPVRFREESAASLWQLYTGAALWVMACRREAEGIPLAYGLILNAPDVYLSARALAVLWSDPERTLEVTGELANERERLLGVACRFVLPGLAVRCPAWARDAARLARRLLERHPIADPNEISRTIRSFEDGLPDVVAAWESCFQPEPMGEVFEAWRRIGMSLSDRGPQSGTPPEVVSAWREILHARRVPLLLPDDPVFPLILSWLPVEALLPPAEPDPLWRRSEGIRYIQDTLSPMVRIRTLAEFKRGPVSKERSPGRNAPCPCGSGRKFKSCHGQVGAGGA